MGEGNEGTAIVGTMLDKSEIAQADSLGWRNLLAGILLQAMKDAKRGDPYLVAQARHWLADRGAALADDWLDIPEDKLAAWVYALDPIPWERVCYFLFDVVETLQAKVARLERIYPAGGDPGGDDGD